MKLYYLIILGIIAIFSSGVAFAESDPVITVKMNGPSTFYLDEPNQIIRATVEIQNYSPSGDGIYFMKVTHLPTQKVMKDFEIYPKASGNDLWSVFNLVQEKVVDGDFEYISGAKLRKARKIKNFKQDLDVNQKLFEVAKEFAA